MNKWAFYPTVHIKTSNSSQHFPFINLSSEPPNLGMLLSKKTRQYVIAENKRTEVTQICAQALSCCVISEVNSPNLSEPLLHLLLKYLSCRVLWWLRIIYPKSLGSCNRASMALKEKKSSPCHYHHYYQYITFRGNTKFEASKWEIHNRNLLKSHGQENGVPEEQRAAPCASLPSPSGSPWLWFAGALLRVHRAFSKSTAAPLRPLYAVHSRVSGSHVPAGSSWASWRLISIPD